MSSASASSSPSPASSSTTTTTSTNSNTNNNNTNNNSNTNTNNSNNNTNNNNNNNNNNSNNNSSTKPRASFNFQFINDGDDEVESVPKDVVAKWTKAQVSEWLTKEDLAPLAELFAKEDIDGQTLTELKDSDLKDIGVSLGNRKKFEKAIAQLLKPPQPKKKTFVMRKGFTPAAQEITASQRAQIQFNQYDITKKAWVPRETPLTSEELACWDEQAAWLVCPISGKKWIDVDSILGVGLYHAPRLLSEKEIQRGIDDELRATQEKQQKRGEGNESDVVVDTTNFAKTFQVYPSVHPPPVGNLDSNKDPAELPLGHVDVIAGPTFDARAFNWGIHGYPEKGILPKKERGVLSMEEQYNAFNFVYYILRAENSYERKICTNRLSFYIDDVHGARVFPANIESQLSLLVFRDKRLCRDSTTLSERQRQALLAVAIRKAIPRVLRAVVMEVVNGRSTALEERIDHAIRTYLLIHQISIKLVLYYRQAYELLYKSIVLWIQNPFAPMCEADWPNLEDVLIGASLVGIPWAIMRESFVKKLLYEAVRNAPKFKGTVSQWIDHLFEHNKQLFHLILYEISFFFTSARSLVEMDKVYSRCAGSLPKAERDAIKSTLQNVEKVSTFLEVWASLGMEFSPDEDVQLDRIQKYLNHLKGNVPRWKKEKLPESKIVVPPPEAQVSADQLRNQGLVLRSELDRQKEEALAVERAKHRGFPPLSKTKHLDRNVCNYPQCGKKFSCRDHLFKHLRKMIEPERMVESYHQKHFRLKVSNNLSLECEACNEVFATIDEIRAHYAARGVPGYRLSEYPATSSTPSTAPPVVAPNNNNNNKGKEKADEKEKKPEVEVDSFADMGSCVICMDKKREAVNIPCGHLICCYDCGLLVKECAMCRVPIRDVIRVYCS